MNKILIIGFIWPEPNSTAAGSRMLQLIQFFIDCKYQITFASTASKTENSFDLKGQNIETVSIELNNISFNEFVKNLNPEIVLFDRYLTEEQFGWRVSENCPTALKILDTEDLHFLRDSRKKALKNETTLTSEIEANKITIREISSIYRCDLTLLISKFEMKLLEKEFNISKKLLFYIPFLHDSEKITDQPSKSFDERNHFMTIGNFKHEPNWDAVLHLKKEIWPIIRKELPTAEIHIYGAYAMGKVKQLENLKDGFIIKGWINNTKKAFVNYKVCLTPLRFGAGLKGKLFDSMKYGTPNVTTTIGSEGMIGKLSWNGFVANNANDFALKAIELYSDKNTWFTSQKNGFIILREQFDKTSFENKFKLRIEKIVKNLRKHRKNNFIGKILLHQSMQSTKYMSKWIEEKNKINSN